MCRGKHDFGRRSIGRSEAQVLIQGLAVRNSQRGLHGCVSRLFVRGMFTLTLALAARAEAQISSALEITTTAELREQHGEGKNAVYRFVPAQRIPQGARVYYTVSVRNRSDVALKDVAVIRPIPDHTHYVRGSATGAGAEIAVSLDGGQTFTTDQSTCALPSNALSNSDGARLPAVRCTHLRWTLRHVLPAGAVVLARFAVLFP